VSGTGRGACAAYEQRRQGWTGCAFGRVTSCSEEASCRPAAHLARAHGLNAGGLPIPEGSALILLIGAANRDPACYPDPDHFDPARTDNAPLSFGAGPHICIGNNLARLEAGIAFPRLLARFPHLSPAGPATRRDRLVLRGYDTLPITTTVRP
jgi:hypothetical protein